MDIPELLAHYKYLILFPLAIVEGPILAIIAGFLCTNGLLNPFIVFPVIVLGDITGDSICYSLGRWGMPKVIRKIAWWLGLHPGSIGRARTYFDSNPVRTVFLSKITLGIGVAGIYMAGNAKIPYGKFIRICLVTSVIQYVFYLGTGLIFGSAYRQINHYIDHIAALFFITALGVILFIYIRSFLNKL
jgi:membrane protein DedA with SNARE-associated domain